MFGNSLELTIPDPDHSEGEFRFLSLGRSAAGRLLVVAYIEREGRIRIINARGDERGTTTILTATSSSPLANKHCSRRRPVRS